MKLGSTGRERQRILVVEDDTALLRLLRRVLQDEGYEAILSQDGISGIKLMQAQAPALVLLDLTLPKLDGFEVCRQIRSRSQVPVIVLSGRHGEGDKVHAFELGADDYITKPFSISELVARIRAVMRRSLSSPATIAVGPLRIGDLEIDFNARRVRRNGGDIRLTPIEFGLLRALAANTGKVLTHQVLLHQVWGPEYIAEREYLRVHLSHLRRKLEPDPAKPRYIQTVPCIGYTFARDRNGASEATAVASTLPLQPAIASHDPDMPIALGQALHQ